MKLAIPLAFAFAGLASATVSSSTIEKCYTAMGPSKPSSVPRTTKAVTITFRPTVKSTSTPSKTVTPSTSTSTTTLFTTTTLSTTLPQVTDTYSSTTTFYETSTESDSTTVTTTTTTTVTTTNSGGTTTIAPSANFTPLASQIAAQGATPNKKRDVVREHPRAVAASSKKAACTFGQQNGHKTVWPAQYPTKVACADLVEVFSTSTSVLTASSTVTVTATTPITTVSTTSTISTTTTATQPDASTTTTISTTSTITTTTVSTISATDTATTTSTVLAPAATYYAACGSDNLVGGVNGHGINSGGFDYGVVTATASSAYDCCVAAIQGGYGGSVYGVPNTQQSDAGVCYLAATSGAGVCNPQEEDVTFYTSSSVAADSLYILSNGDCGHDTWLGN